MSFRRCSPVAGKKTIVVKIGTSSLTEKSGRLSPERLRALTAQVADLRDEGHHTKYDIRIYFIILFFNLR